VLAPDFKSILFLGLHLLLQLSDLLPELVYGLLLSFIHLLLLLKLFLLFLDHLGQDRHHIHRAQPLPVLHRHQIRHVLRDEPQILLLLVRFVIKLHGRKLSESRQGFFLRQRLDVFLIPPAGCVHLRRSVTVGSSRPDIQQMSRLNADPDIAVKTKIINAKVTEDKGD
jgi:hypothetical protein